MLVFGTLVACCEHRDTQTDDRSLAEEVARVPTHPVHAGSDPSAAPSRQVAEEPPPAGARLQEVLAQPGLPGAPELESHRSALLARAKAEPIVFVRPPEPTQAKGAAKHYRAQLLATSYHWDVLVRLLPTLAERPDIGRDVLLREGYLFAEQPDLAFAMVSLVGVQHLFREPRVWIQRGENLVFARRDRGRYFYEAGPLAGELVKLMHLDRVGAGKPPPPLHVDLRALRYRIHFERARVRHITEEHVVADLRYGELWVPTLLIRNGARLELDHFDVPPGTEDAFRQLRDAAQRRFHSIGALQRSIIGQVYEGLPFDEPLTERGQQDGRLRPSWVYVYSRGLSSFRFQGDRYPVFDKKGRPLVPQVCADFLLDTFERAAGTWWRPEGEPPGRTTGLLDLELDRNDLRRTVELVRFFDRHPDWFDVWTVPLAEQIPMGMKPAFFGWVAEHADRFEPGDVVLIRGKTPWDAREEHTHSFFVLDTDPVSGVPLAVAGNPGRPSLWSWETEARRTPLRTVRHVVRAKLAWLEGVVDPTLAGTLEPPPLAVETSSRPGW